MKKNILITLMALLIAPTSAVVLAKEAESEKSETKIWSLEDCLEYGLKNHPKVIMADNDVKSAEASLLSAKSSFDPSISASVSWRGSRNERERDSKTGEYNTNGHFTQNHDEGLSLSKKLYDSGRFSLQKKEAVEALKSAKKDRETTLIALAANIKTMYFKAQQAQCLLQVKLETLDGYEKHLKKVESFVEIGTHAPYDITKAQVDVANARVDLISAKNTLKQALVNVGNAIGIGESVHVAPYELMELPDIDESSKEELIRLAMERPEVKSMEAKLRATKLKIKEAKSALKPTISANAGYSWKNDYTPQDHGWSVGAGISWPIYNGRSTIASINSAKSAYAKNKASYDNLKLDIDKEVENGISDIVDSVQRVKAYGVVVQQASESLYLAEGRYDAGLGSPLEITDARVDYEKAKGNWVSAYFECLISQTNLDKILGKMPLEYGLNKAVEKLNDSIITEESGGKPDIEYPSEENGDNK